MCIRDRHWIERFPVRAGSYALILQNQNEKTIQAGGAGSFVFKKGLYVYFGSAKGPGGIRARVTRHLRLEKKLHWHVDYLIRSMPVVAVGWRIAEERYECLWSRRAVEQWGAEVPALGLGASDCREKCPAHLLYLSGGEEDLAYLWQEMEIWKLG